jgi:hypothetical protein
MRLKPLCPLPSAPQGWLRRAPSSSSRLGGWSGSLWCCAPLVTVRLPRPSPCLRHLLLQHDSYDTLLSLHMPCHAPTTPAAYIHTKSPYPPSAAILTDILVLAFERFVLARQIIAVCEPDLGEGAYDSALCRLFAAHAAHVPRPSCLKQLAQALLACRGTCPGAAHPEPEAAPACCTVGAGSADLGPTAPYIPLPRAHLEDVRCPQPGPLLPAAAAHPATTALLGGPDTAQNGSACWHWC